MPMTILAMDTIGRQPVTSKGHHYALSAICFHMSFVFMIPLKENSAEHLVHAYLTVILTNEEWCCVILSDNRSEFCNKSLIAACDQLGKMYSNPFHPEGNSCVENCHNLLKRNGTKFLELLKLEWDDLLPSASYCYNVILSCTRTESPFFLMFVHDLAEGRLQHFKNKLWYYGDDLEQLLLVRLHMLWTCQAQLLKDTGQCRYVPVDHNDDDAEPMFKTCYGETLC